MRPTSAVVDLAAVTANAAELARRAAPAELCAVVKADGYGHGSVAVGRAALAGGATWLGVALVEEGVELREAGVAAPILLLSEPRPNEMVEVVAHDLRPSVYSPEGLAAAAAAAATAGRRLPVHLKIDTGMNRVGARPTDALLLARAIAAKSDLRLEGVWTHCAVADELDNPFTEVQLERYERVLGRLAAGDGVPGPLRRHAANSALLLSGCRPDVSPIRRRGRYDMVRAGIALYGLSPGADLVSDIDGLRPVMGLRTEVAYVKTVRAGEAISYGLAHRFDSDRQVATVPIGYADGARRDYGLRGGQVLIRGRRRSVVGTVTMDQLMVDCGPDEGASGEEVVAGDEVVLIGSQGDESIAAEEVAARLGTIPYEVVCDIGRRVRRHYR
ncbi:MAG: alanine racemase [Acidimicrobiia bacterium]|nr:alanine racemase [Acidimicrobiia bacterium]MYC45598.1 alanine racemase [Acidimicrobiia bacterium]